MKKGQSIITIIICIVLVLGVITGIVIVNANKDNNKNDKNDNLASNKTTGDGKVVDSNKKPSSSSSSNKDKNDYGTSKAGYKLVGEWQIDPKDYKEGCFTTSEYDGTPFTIIDNYNESTGYMKPDSILISDKIIDMSKIHEAKRVDDIVDFFYELLEVSKLKYDSQKYDINSITKDELREKITNTERLSSRTNYKDFEFYFENGGQIDIRLWYEAYENKINKSHIGFISSYNDYYGIDGVYKLSKDEVLKKFTVILNYKDLDLSILIYSMHYYDAIYDEPIEF